MSDVLGSMSFLSKPDVNGNLVLIEGDAVETLSGTADQITVTGTLPNRTVSLADNFIAPGTGSITLPIGTTAQRPTGTNGMIRYNSTLGFLETFDNSWVRVGAVKQVVTGTFPNTSFNNQIPYDNTVPLITEGAQLFSVSFTPLSANSTIIVIVNSFYAIASNNDVYATGAIFNGNTCVSAIMLGFTTNTGNGNNFTVTANFDSVSTTARNISFRAGPNSNVTMHVGQGTGGQAYGSSDNTSHYIIMEIQ